MGAGLFSGPPAENHKQSLGRTGGGARSNSGLVTGGNAPPLESPIGSNYVTGTGQCGCSWGLRRMCGHTEVSLDLGSGVLRHSGVRK